MARRFEEARTDILESGLVVKPKRKNIYFEI